MNNLTTAVLDFFRQISAIPRQSGNEKGMQEYLVNFAINRHLPYYQDQYNNVIIYKKTADQEPIILQAHTDMVYVKTPNSQHDLRRDGINLVVKGNWLHAKDTSLGADDGIGVALILAILDADIPCNLEAVFTASEETTMQGAYQLDITKLKAKKLICLDGFENNAIVVSSASFTDFLVNFATQSQPLSDSGYCSYRIVISGLAGGHSGFDIDKQRGNSHQLAVSLLRKLPNVLLSKFVGGHQFNVIPAKTEVIFATTTDEITMKKQVTTFLKEQQKLYPLLKITFEMLTQPVEILRNSENILQFISEFTYGVLLKDEQANVIVSQNLSEVDTTAGTMKIGIRSNIDNEAATMVNQLKALCQKCGLNGTVIDTQPGFNTLPNSSLLTDLQRANPMAEVIKMHIAVECGIFQSRIPNLDTVIISPTILNAHSPEEKLDLDSVANTVNWLKEYLINFSVKY